MLLLALLQATDVRVEGSIPLWFLVVALVGGVFALGWLTSRVMLHGRYHREHYAHANDRDLHPDPEIAAKNLQLMAQSQEALNEKLRMLIKIVEHR